MNKTFNSLKLSMMALLAMGLFTFTACGDDDDDNNNVPTTQKDFSEQYFSVQGGTYHNETMPTSTTDQTISGISISSEKGGAVIEIDSDVEYDRFYVGVEGVPGYMECVPTAVTRASNYSYQASVTFSSKASEKMNMQVKGKTKGGDITPEYSQTVGTFGADLGTNNVAAVRGDWRYVENQEDDMGQIYYDYTFQGSFASGKIADFRLDQFDDIDAWRVQVEGQYKLMGSTLRLYVRRVRDKTFSSRWTEWVTKGASSSMGMYRIDWQNTYNKWTDYVNEGEGSEIWECIVNDAKTEMQWRRLQPVYNYDYISGKTYVSYNYYENEPIRHLRKL